MTTVENVQIVLTRLAELLRFGNLEEWAKALDKHRFAMERDSTHAASEILMMYGGMGSLNDIVLHRDGRPMGAENDEFESLRSKLYELCRALRSGQSGQE